MHRILAENAELRERRNQLRHPAYAKPELLATSPNKLWSWDITKLHGPAKWTYFYLYVILDVYSRYVVGWMVAHRESATLAQKLIAETCAREGIAPGQLTIHILRDGRQIGALDHPRERGRALGARPELRQRAVHRFVAHGFASCRSRDRKNPALDALDRNGASTRRSTGDLLVDLLQPSLDLELPLLGRIAITDEGKPVEPLLLRLQREAQNRAPLRAPVTTCPELGDASPENGV
jgi:transposase InsO family protein